MIIYNDYFLRKKSDTSFWDPDDPPKPFLCKGFAEATFGRGDCKEGVLVDALETVFVSST